MIWKNAVFVSLLLVVFFSLSACEPSELVGNETLNDSDAIDVNKEDDSEQEEPVQNNDNEEDVEKPPVNPGSGEIVRVLNGDFESGLSGFDDYDNYPKVGYTFAVNALNPVSGKADVKIIISSAEKGAEERPAFTVDLSSEVVKGKKYKIGVSYDEFKGNFNLVSVGFGGDWKTLERTTSQLSKEIWRQEFLVSADVASDKIYFYFDGTKISTFRIDDISIEESD